MSEARDETAARPDDLARGVVEAVVAGFGLDGPVEVTGDAEEIRLTVAGTGLGGLIGESGATIDAVQALASHAVHRHHDRVRIRVVVDAEGYRARRVAALEALAGQAAAEAVEHGEEIELDAMNPAERRIIHLALRDDETVVTRSEGEEPRRRIIVEPAGGVEPG